MVVLRALRRYSGERDSIAADRSRGSPADNEDGHVGEQIDIPVYNMPFFRIQRDAFMYLNVTVSAEFFEIGN
jgi:hypothetical protein